MKQFISIFLAAIIFFEIGGILSESAAHKNNQSWPDIFSASGNEPASAAETSPETNTTTDTQTIATTKILYCQKERCDREVVNQIMAARSFVYFAMYTITRQSIVDALIGAKLRGLEVRGVLDFNQSLIVQEKPEISQLKKAGVELESPFMADGGLMHMKLLVTDSAYVSGSFNWTNAATLYNDEVIESGSAPSIRQQYQKVFEALWKQYAASKL
jgi:phosphatidylserine/phosphatidylglycerophosphate/cardiolipin synthase-like enzyme